MSLACTLHPGEWQFLISVGTHISLSESGLPSTVLDDTVLKMVGLQRIIL